MSSSIEDEDAATVAAGNVTLPVLETVQLR
jgi:hypothetical protein